MSVFLFRKLSVDFQHFRVFVFAIEHIRKPGNHGKFSEAQFSSYYKAFYLILSTLLGILCDQDTTLKVLLKVMDEHLLLFLESGFSDY